MTTAAIGFTGIIVAGTTHFVLPTGANLAVLIAETTAGLRWRDDGTAPTPSVGMLMTPGMAPFEYSGNLSAFQMISVSGTVSVSASFFRTEG